jgi:DNA-directed RNA polymerase
MTFGYGSKKYGFATQLQEYVMGLPNYRDIKKHFLLPDSTGKMVNSVPKACSLMAALIWDALGIHVSGAFVGMEWMQRAARGVAANGKCVSWIVPSTGFPVKQEYMKYTQRQIATVLAGKDQITGAVRCHEPTERVQAGQRGRTELHSLARCCVPDDDGADGEHGWCRVLRHGARQLRHGRC